MNIFIIYKHFYLLKNKYNLFNSQRITNKTHKIKCVLQTIWTEQFIAKSFL